MDSLRPSESSSASPRRPWLVAFLVWLSICCTTAIVVLVEYQIAGREHFSTAVGQRQLVEFLRHSLVFPGLVLPAVLLWKPRFAIVFCALLLAAEVFLLVTRLGGTEATRMYLPFWVGTVVPVGLLALATGLAYYRGDWRPRAAARVER